MTSEIDLGQSFIELPLFFVFVVCKMNDGYLIVFHIFVKTNRKRQYMKTKEEYLADLRLFKEKFAAKYGIRSIGIFGSVARGEHRDDSDLDVFVELEEPDFYTMHDIRMLFNKSVAVMLICCACVRDFGNC